MKRYTKEFEDELVKYKTSRIVRLMNDKCNLENKIKEIDKQIDTIDGLTYIPDYNQLYAVNS